MSSNFTSKRRFAGQHMHNLSPVELAKNYADNYGYEMRGGGMIYDPAGNRVCRGWSVLADHLTKRGLIEVGVGILPRFMVGDRILVWDGNMRSVVTVEGVDCTWGYPLYSFTTSYGPRSANDSQCSPAPSIAARAA